MRNALGEQSIKADVADAGERKAFTVVGKETGSLRSAFGHDEVAIEALVCRAGADAVERIDWPCPGGRIGRGSNLGAA
jgi:hypothetical protein